MKPDSGLWGVTLEFLNSLSPLLPITALVAIGLFLAKEVMELVRRRRADARKLGAIRRILSRDLELNQWVLEALRNAVGALERIEAEHGRKGRIYESPGKRIRYEHWVEGDKHRSDGGLPSVYATNFDRYLLDVATLDRKMLSYVEIASTALANLDHVRSGVVEHIDDQTWRGSFVLYARGELDKAEIDLQRLYQYCTGAQKVPVRLR